MMKRWGEELKAGPRVENWKWTVPVPTLRERVLNILATYGHTHSPSSPPPFPSLPFLSIYPPLAMITPDNANLADCIMFIHISINTNHCFNLGFILLWRVQKCHSYRHQCCFVFHILTSERELIALPFCV